MKLEGGGLRGGNTSKLSFLEPKWCCASLWYFERFDTSCVLISLQPYDESSPQLHRIVRKLKLTFRSIEYFIIVLLFVILFVLVHICINSPITLASAPLSGVPGLSYSWHWDPYPSPLLSSRTQFANIITVISFQWYDYNNSGSLHKYRVFTGRDQNLCNTKRLANDLPLFQARVAKVGSLSARAKMPTNAPRNFFPCPWSKKGCLVHPINMDYIPCDNAIYTMW